MAAVNLVIQAGEGLPHGRGGGGLIGLKPNKCEVKYTKGSWSKA